MYSPQLLVCEKIRAICQQMPEYKKIIKTHQAPRARDFYDIYHIVRGFNLNLHDAEFIKLLRIVFETKQVPLEFIKKIPETKEFHRLEENSLRDTLFKKEKYKGFDFYFNFVTKKLKDLNL